MRQPTALNPLIMQPPETLHSFLPSTPVGTRVLRARVGGAS